MSAITLLKIASPRSPKNLLIFNISRITSFLFATHSIISTKINSFIPFKILYIPLMFLPLATVNKLPQFDLKPIHGSISFLYFPQRFLLISLQKYLNQLVEIVNLFLILSQSVLPQCSQVLFNLISQYNAIIFDQL